jgi:hypothetical protein
MMEMEMVMEVAMEVGMGMYPHHHHLHHLHHLLLVLEAHMLQGLDLLM